MGTTHKTSQSNQYDPTSMGVFKGLQPGLQSTLQGYMTNPFGNPFFQTQQQMGTRQAQNLGQTGMSNITRNLTASGFGGGSSSPFAMEMMQNQARANSGLQAQLGFLSPVQNALGMQQFATGLASQYRPLQTGQQTTEKTSGLGTWLPQVAGLGMSFLPGGQFGGMFGGGGGAFSGAGAHPFMPSGGGLGGWAGSGPGLADLGGYSTGGGMFGGQGYGFGGAGLGNMPPPPPFG